MLMVRLLSFLPSETMKSNRCEPSWLASGVNVNTPWPSGAIVIAAVWPRSGTPLAANVKSSASPSGSVAWMSMVSCWPTTAV